MRTPRLFAHASGKVGRHGKAIAAAVPFLILGALVVPGGPSSTPSLSARLAAATRVAAPANGSGYWLVSSDGKVTAFGGAQLYGSMAGKQLTAPIVGIVATADGRGYWLVAKDGGVFSFGNAPFAGSLGSKSMATAIVGMASSGSGSSAPAGQGPQGLIGPAGPAGATGPSGLAGTDGLIGAPGLVGSAGADGQDGTNGSDGADGADGTNGAPGAAGAAGAAGPAGSIVGSACTKGSTQGTIAQVVDASTGVVTFTCTTLVLSNALISGGWGILTGSGLMPGSTLSECYNLFPGCGPTGLSVAGDGTTNSAPGGALFACGAGIANAYFKGFTAAGDPIESNHVNASC